MRFVVLKEGMLLIMLEQRCNTNLHIRWISFLTAPASLVIRNKKLSLQTIEPFGLSRDVYFYALYSFFQTYLSIFPRFSLRLKKNFEVLRSI